MGSCSRLSVGSIVTLYFSGVAWSEFAFMVGSELCKTIERAFEDDSFEKVRHLGVEHGGGVFQNLFSILASSYLYFPPSSPQNPFLLQKTFMDIPSFPSPYGTQSLFC